MKGEIMDVIDVVAIVGAAAWTPQIGKWVYSFFTKPKLSIYLHSQPEIGYTSYGPIFNMSCALLSKHKDAILNKLSVVLRHDSGASYTFDWAGLSEDLSEIQDNIGSTLSIRRSSLPLVIKVLHTGVAQMFVRFQHGQFKANLRKATVSAQDRLNFMKTAGKLNTEEEVEALTSEQEYDEVMKLLHSEFIWRAGKYTVTFEFGSPNKFKYEKSEYTFELNQDDIENLRKNLDTMKLALIQGAKAASLSGYKAKPINWVWRNPELRKKGGAELPIH